MATALDSSLGATAVNQDDPFVTYNYTQVRYGAPDAEQLSLLSNGSPSQARRALEAHLKDTDRRIQDASRLGTTLLQQRRDLSARLDDVKQIQQDNDVPADLRKKLADLEKEYNEVGRESARAFLPKARVASDVTGTPSAYSGSGRESPTKLSAPSRRQRNLPSNRVYDIEFATEISTSLLAQVRQLQTALAEKEEAVKDLTAVEAQMQGDLAGMALRIKQMDEKEQRYKDENWNLETKLQELEAVTKDSSDKEHRLVSSLKVTQSEKAATQRDFDDLKLSHERLNEEHAAFKRQQEVDLFTLRRDATTHETDRQRLQRRIDELAAQNAELAKAASSRWHQHSNATDTEFVSADEDLHGSDNTPDHSEPASPVKGTPRHGMLESETLKSSLTHAHRMIQNLKNNIHREKTEKIEIKRMLQDARDELEARRSETGVSASLAKKRRAENDSKFKKPAKPSVLGANRASTIEITEDDPDWEDHDDQHTPSKSNTFSSAVVGTAIGAAGMAALDSADGETADDFETATEREGATTDAFETGRESMGDEDSDALTETEDGANHMPVRRGVSPLVSARPSSRQSFFSTASTSAGEEEEDPDLPRTPLPAAQPKYRLRVNRGSKRTRGGELATESPVSSVGTPQPMGQSLGDELDALDEDSIGGTPGPYSPSEGTPFTARLRSIEPDSPQSVRQSIEGVAPLAAPAVILGHQIDREKPPYADAGIMTDAWEPEKEIQYVTQEPAFREKAEGVVGGALAGLGFGWLGAKSDNPSTETHLNSNDTEEHERPMTALATSPHELPTAMTKEQSLTQSEISSQETVPIAPINAHVPETQLGLAEPMLVECAPRELPRAVVPETIMGMAVPIAVDTAPVASVLPVLPQIRLGLAEPIALDTVPVEPKLAIAPQTRLGLADPIAVDTEPREPAQHFVSVPLPVPESAPGARLGLSEPIAMENPPQAPASEPAPHFGFSSIIAQDFEPVEAAPATPILPARAANRASIVPGPEIDEYQERFTNRSLGQGAGLFRTFESPVRSTRDAETSPMEIQAPPPKFAYSEIAAQTIPRKPLNGINADLASESRAEPISAVPAKAPVIDEGSQTLMSGKEIESLLQKKSTPLPVFTPVVESSNSPVRPTTAIGPGSARAIDEASPLRTPKRPSSAGSTRSKTVVLAPPLPIDHTQKIAAAQKAPTSGSMGPPIMPASAYRQTRPVTPHSRHGARSAQAMRSQTSPGGASRRSSMSSFASELDERFNLHHGYGMYPDDVKPATDPRMIQAITQTMIGEFLWKYTRKAGRSETSSTRHRRFFWVHPYTRTLYWSEHDPTTAGRDTVKAKSVAIEAVRIMSDDNAYPPGLHRKSLVIVTPGREIIVTAPTGQRHETWFNALSYLLLRTEHEKQDADEVASQETTERHPGVTGSVRRSISRMTGRSQSRVSLSSYNSRTTANSTYSPTRGVADPILVPTLAQRQSNATTQSSFASRLSGAGTPDPGATIRQSTQRDSTTSGGRLSSLTNKFRASSGQRASVQSANRGRASLSSRHGGQPGDPSDIYDASVVDESAEDLRTVMARQEQQADRVENVRACCDGKHDVGSLSHRATQGGSLASRFSTHGTHSYSSRHDTLKSRH